MLIETWALFFALALAAVLLPGPAMLAILAHAVGAGAGATLPVVAGNAVGVALLITASAMGLAAFLGALPFGFESLKWTGAAYLFWLGIKAWRTLPPPSTPAVLQSHEEKRNLSIARGFVRGCIIALSNPKAILFFGAILPQFIDTARPALPLLGILAGTFVGLELAVTLAIAVGAGAISPLLKRPSTILLTDKIGGSIMILAALALAIPSSSRS